MPKRPVGNRMWTEMHGKRILVHVPLCFSDLTGAQDGSVRMFEWGHSQQIICFRSPGNSRVTRIRFNHQGNKVRKPHTQVVYKLEGQFTFRCQTSLSFALWLYCDASLSDAATFLHVFWQSRHSGTIHGGELGFSTHCSSAEWFNRSELRHSPRANHLLRWCLSCASTILSVLAKEGNTLKTLERQDMCRALDFFYLRKRRFALRGSWCVIKDNSCTVQITCRDWCFWCCVNSHRTMCFCPLSK